MDIRSKVIEQFSKVATELDKKLSPLTDNLPFLESGMDSFCLAILVPRLENSLGIDPFSAEEILFPALFGEFVSCYEACA